MGETVEPAERNTRIRCPFCVAPLSTTLPRSSRQKIECAKCHKWFKVIDALSPHVRTSETEASVGRSGLLFGFGGGIWLVAWIIGRELDGPGFLTLYVLLGFVLALTARGIHDARQDASSVLLLLVTWESIGVWRYLYGTWAGMQQWSDLWTLMLIGGILFLVVGGLVETGGSRFGSRGGGFFGGCGGGAGCGGGGGCGGGCGGCGGGG